MPGTSSPIVVIGVGIAKADVEGAEGDHDVAAFVSELYPDGVYLSAPQGLDLATRVCTNHALGITRDQMIDGDEKMYSIDLSVDVVMGAEFVTSAPRTTAFTIPCRTRCAGRNRAVGGQRHRHRRDAGREVASGHSAWRVCVDHHETHCNSRAERGAGMRPTPT